ncbi:MAG: PAS domain S-box protein [Hyphomicrobium sp.]
MSQDRKVPSPLGSAQTSDGANASSLALQLLASSPWSAALLYPDGRIRAINSTALELFGSVQDANLEGRDMSSLWPPDSAEIIESAVERASKGMRVVETAYRPSGKGVPRWIEVTLSPIRNDDGTLAWVMCNLRDATQLTTMQHSLSVSEKRFRALADNIAQLAWMADAQGYIFWYNKRWFDYTGMTLPEMEGWGWKNVHHPDHIDRVMRKWESNLESGQVWEDTFPLRAANGSYRWFLSRAMPIRDAADNIELWCGTNTDITEQRLATQRLRQKARLIELSHEAIFSWDLTGAIISWNRGCQELYGYSQREAIGRVSHELLRSEHCVPLPEMLEILKSDGVWSGEILHYAKDGTKVLVDSRHELLGVGGRHIVLESNRDISERRKGDEIRNMLVAELNHRVKNTLAIVQSIAGQTARTSTSIEQFVGSFRGRLHSLSNAHNVLTDAHWYGADLRNLLVSELAVTLGSTENITIEGEKVFLSPQSALQFTLVLHELANNALKYGALSCPSGRVEISWKRTGPKGEVLNFVWREIDGPKVSSPTRRGFGTLLIERSGGLPHMKTDLRFNQSGVECLIEANLDDDAISEPVMFNPIRKEAPLEVHARPETPSSVGESQRILLIVDDPLVVLELQQTLIDAGFKPVGPATTVESVLEAIARGGADAAIVDVAFLGSSTSKVIQRLEADGVPFILLTRDGAGVEESAQGRTFRRGARISLLIDTLSELLA